MGKYIFKRCIFSIYDETDNLKKLRDADILDEREKSREGHGGEFRAAIGGGILGAGAGAAALGSAKLLGKAKGGKFGKAAAIGAGIGAVIGAARAGKKRREENSKIDFYNSRLDYAKRQARRRERKDWKANMTQRDGYSY